MIIPVNILLRDPGAVSGAPHPTDHNTTRLQKLQNRAARIITRKGYEVRSANVRKELRWDDLATNRRKHIAIVRYKIVNKRAPGYLIDVFEKYKQ